MNTYASNLDLDQVVERLCNAKSLLVTTHAKPDGDAYGSVVALTQALRDIGKEAHGLLMPPVPRFLRLLKGGDVATLHSAGEKLPDVDLVVIVDTGAWSQLAPMRSELEPLTDKMLIIDHHLNGDVPAAGKYVDEKAAACCELIAQVVDRLEPDKDLLSDALIAESLYIGIASDTGWFRFSNTRPQTHQLAAKLLSHDVDHALLYLQSEQAERAEKLQLLIRALTSLQLVANESAAVMVLRRQDFAQTGALAEETERFVDVPQVVQSVQTVVLVCESIQDGEPIRISFRSKPGTSALNVAELAQQFGGGGHARAAGAKVDGELEETVAQVIAAIEKASLASA